jgi:hypothetical protein
MDDLKLKFLAFIQFLINQAGHGSRAVYGMNCLHPFGCCDPGFESHLGQGCLVCLHVYSVFVLSCIYVEALGRADHSSNESYRLYIDTKKIKTSTP